MSERKKFHDLAAQLETSQPEISRSSAARTCTCPRCASSAILRTLPGSRAST